MASAAKARPSWTSPRHATNRSPPPTRRESCRIPRDLRVGRGGAQHRAQGQVGDRVAESHQLDPAAVHVSPSVDASSRSAACSAASAIRTSGCASAGGGGASQTGWLQPIGWRDGVAPR